MKQKDQLTSQASEDVTAPGMAAEPVVACSSESHSLARVGEFHRFILELELVEKRLMDFPVSYRRNPVALVKEIR